MRHTSLLALVAALAIALGATGVAAASAPMAVDAASDDGVATTVGDATDVTRNVTSTVDGVTDGDTNGTTDNTTDAVDGTTDNTTDAVDEVTGTVDDAANDTTGNGTTDNTTDAVDGVVRTATGVVDGNATVGANATVGDRTSTATHTPSAGNGTATRARNETATHTRNGSAPAGDGEGDGTPGGDSGGIGVEEGAAAVGIGTALAAAVTHRTGVATTVGTLPNASSVRTAALSGWRTVDGWAYRLLGLAGYSRYDDSDPLEHDTRESLYRRITATPGQHLSALDARTDGAFSTVRHHLRVLEREDLVTSHRVRGRRRYFPAGTERQELAAALVDESTATVLDALARTGPASVSDLATELDRDPSTVTHHLQRLDEDGLVERERDGRRVETRLAPDVASVLRTGPASASSD